MDYLKNEQYYNDLYDLFTIKECLNVVKFWQDIYKKKDTDNQLKKIPPEEVEKGFNYYYGWQLRVTKGERYRRRDKTIAEWVERDRVKQDKLDNAHTPLNIFCSACNTEMVASDFKHLEDFDDNKPLRVLFMFECPKCKKRRGIYDDGEERVSTPEPCPKCGNELKRKYKRKGKVLTTTITCGSCKYKNIEVDDFAKSDAEWKAKQQKDKVLLEKYRSEFCLTDKDGQEYIELMEAMEVASVVREEETQKYDSPVYQRSLQLKKTTIADLEKLLTSELEEARYTKLSLDKPEIGQYVIVPFTVQDSDSSRKDRVSASELEKLIKNTLEDTNWRLVSNSVYYRLGYLEGRLKGYEQEEDMLKLAGKKETPKPKSKISEELRQKYSSHNLVQLARLFGEHDGIENMRKRRLKNEPEGFFLEASEGPYNCGICSQLHPGNEIWWNPDGLRCAECWRNIKNKAIPYIKSRHEDKKIWFEKWDIQSKYGVHPSSIKKLRRESVLHGRDLLDKNGNVYFTVYLVKENQEFFKKYPAKPRELEV